MGLFDKTYETVQIGQIWKHKTKNIQYTIFKLKEHIFDDCLNDIYTFFHHEDGDICMGGGENFLWESDFLAKMKKLELEVVGIDEERLKK